MFSFFRKKSPHVAPATTSEARTSDDDDAAAFAAAEAMEAELGTQAVITADTFVSVPLEAKPEPASSAGPVLAPDSESQLTAPSLATPDPSPSPSPPSREGWMQRLRQGLRKTGAGFAGLFTDAKIDDTLYEELESALLMADAGVNATHVILDDVKRRVAALKLTQAASVKQLLVESLMELLLPLEGPLLVGESIPTVVMVAGVNGAGKTTSIGKLTRHLAEADCKVLLAAADTFRAAAKEQLAVWADRTQVEIVSQEGGDPAAVAYDAVAAGTARGCDVVIVDTAGRLATQPHLMDELRKIKRSVTRAYGASPLTQLQAPAPHEVLLVVDGNTGQNALAQAKAFDEAIEITGLIVTKLDGTAKGGVLAAMALWAKERAAAKPDARPIKVYFIGVGETLADLERFSAFEFARALFE